MALATLRDLYIEELKDLYSAENQLLKALPKMAKAASSDELKKAFDMHLEETKGHADRLESLFKTLGVSPKGKSCKAMQGLIEEGSEYIKKEIPAPVKDAALIAAAQRVEHYEIAAYGSARAFAEQLGESDAAAVLTETLEEEAAADEKLSELALGSINADADAEGSQIEAQ